MEKVEVKGREVMLLHPRNTVIVTCCTPDGKPNAITLSWFTPLSFKPPMVAISVAPKRYSHKLISEVGEFVINVPSMELFRQMWICGVKSGRDADKIKECGFTLEPSLKVKPPSIKECIAHLECKVVNKLEVGDHTAFIGEVVAARVRKDVFDNIFDVLKVKHIFHIGYDSFTTTANEVKKASL
ncbi:MAG: flavin reductase family protein [Candidatus Nezhaarchaeales archaeon]